MHARGKKHQSSPVEVEAASPVEVAAVELSSPVEVAAVELLSPVEVAAVELSISTNPVVQKILLVFLPVCLVGNISMVRTKCLASKITTTVLYNATAQANLLIPHGLVATSVEVASVEVAAPT